jgi:hypothetical protein
MRIGSQILNARIAAQALIGAAFAENRDSFKGIADKIASKKRDPKVFFGSQHRR